MVEDREADRDRSHQKFRSMVENRLVETFSDLTSDGERFAPFRWQERLLVRFLDGKLPKAVDIPTGLGKTSVMALWLIALAEGSNLPRRLVYVVDRRAVVDQATRFAERLRRNLPVAISDRLRLDRGTEGLPISTLRGGFADNRDWLEDPSKPAIVVGTVDMVGSRLLFEGYGVSRRMRPYHAGLLAVDSLVLLDEAHLCPPFEALLQQIAAHRDGKLGPKKGFEPITPPFRLMSLSATGRTGREKSPKSVFSLEDGDDEEPLVRQRLTARKRLKVTEVTDPRTLADCLAARAIELGASKAPARVLVYCHSRRDAVRIKTLIDKELRRRRRAGALPTGYASELLVGERRVYERTRLESWLEDHGLLGGADSPPNKPTFLIATSAGEVGVDLDADHLVCDLVAYERMVQRLGRVNRRGGKDRTAMVDVFAVLPKLKSKASAAARKRYELEELEFQARSNVLRKLPPGEDRRRDASPSAAVKLRLDHPDLVSKATSPEPLHAELTRPLLDAWSMTSLKRHEGRPEVAPWLRGWEDDEQPRTDVVWRKHLPYVCSRTDITVSRTMAAEFFRAAPVHATEKLEAASSRVLDWLLKRVVRVGKRAQDHRLAVGEDEVVAILMNRAGELEENAKLSDLQWLATPARNMNRSEKRSRDRRKKEWKERLLPGAVLVLDMRIGGLRDGLLDEKSKAEALAADADQRWRDWKEDPSATSSPPVIKWRVEEITAREDREGLKLSDDLEVWRPVRTFETRLDAGGVARRGLAVYKWGGESEDEDSRSILSSPQTLTDHTEQVVASARELACRLGLPSDEVEAISIAARLHDVGKDARRWQDAMNAPKDNRPYAKTRGGGNWRLLEGYRHEFGSLLSAERENLPDNTRDLILHLIAAHHGYARPLIRSAGCDDGPPSLMESKAGDAARRFARLQKQYGPWGLAWREAILRAADQGASRDWSTRHRKNEDG